MDDADLVRAARAGDRDALDTLIRRHRAAVDRTCRRVLRDRADAEDAAQEALVQALVALPRLRDPDRFAAWLPGIAHNVARRMLRRRRALDALLRAEAGRWATWPPSATGPAASPEEAVLERERRGVLAAALAEMPALAREAVVAVDLGGASYGEAAARLAVPASTVRGRLHEGRKRLRARLADEETIRPAAPAATKEAAVEELVEMDLAGVGFVRRLGDPPAETRRVVLLRERGGERTADVPAGAAGDDVEAALAGEPPAALAAGLVAALGARVERVVLDAAGEMSWNAVVVLDGGGRSEVPARAGEALALAAAVGAPVACRAAALDRAVQAPAEPRPEDLAAEIAALRARVGDREPPPAEPVSLPAEAEQAAREVLAALSAATGADHALVMHRGGALVATAGDVDLAAAERYARARATGEEELAALIRLEAFAPPAAAIVCFREIGDGWRLEVGFAGRAAESAPRPEDERIERAAARLAEVLAGAG